jgi:hypothetical protein
MDLLSGFALRIRNDDEVLHKLKSLVVELVDTLKDEDDSSRGEATQRGLRGRASVGVIEAEREEPASPSVDDTISLLNGILARNPTDDWTSCTRHIHSAQLTLSVDRSHQTLSLVEDYPAASCDKTDSEPQRFLALNLDTDVPIEGDTTCDKDAWCKFPVINRLNGNTYLSLHCSRGKPCGRYPGNSQYLGGSVDPMVMMILWMSGDAFAQKQAAIHLLHLVRLMKRENSN